MKRCGLLWATRLRFVICLVVPGTMWFVPGTPHAVYAQEKPAADQHTVWDGVYNEAQAARGEVLYTESCSGCHAPDLRGDNTSPSLVGMSFTFLWGGSTLGELFNRIQEQMPTDRPGSLSDQTYRDILAFVLRSNSYPAGTQELEHDLLDQILISANPAPQR
jgi:mono/diheme cytochrome c family protein